jgi:acyl carrier protein
MKLHSTTLILFATLIGGLAMAQPSADRALIANDTRSVIANHLQILDSKVLDNATFASLGADDLDLVEITMALEDALGIVISDDALVSAAGVTRDDSLSRHLTVKTFIKVAATSEKQSSHATSTTGGSEDKIPVGSYADLKTQPIPAGHVLIFIPSLAAILVNHEQKVGTSLTESQVLAIRDRSAVMAVPETVAAEMGKSRGYTDISPEHCWQDWLHLKKALQETETEP